MDGCARCLTFNAPPVPLLDVQFHMLRQATRRNVAHHSPSGYRSELPGDGWHGAKYAVCKSAEAEYNVERISSPDANSNWKASSTWQSRRRRPTAPKGSLENPVLLLSRQRALCRM